ncbi:MAG: glycosyltransferase [Flavobacteriales bacterium]|nr:glycosyltransferase [Flavobacteriales bacterium]
MSGKGRLLNAALDQLGHNDAVLVRIGGKNGGSTRSNHTIDTGYIEDPMVLAQYYAATDVFVLPSSAENLPNTISEALLCGCPVVAFNVGGIPEQINPENGMLVTEREPAILSAAIREALQRSWNSSAISAAAVARYDRREIARTYSELYKF